MSWRPHNPPAHTTCMSCGYGNAVDGLWHDATTGKLWPAYKCGRCTFNVQIKTTFMPMQVGMKSKRITPLLVPQISAPEPHCKCAIADLLSNGHVAGCAWLERKK